jgi:hypothetical protein
MTSTEEVANRSLLALVVANGVVYLPAMLLKPENREGFQQMTTYSLWVLAIPVQPYVEEMYTFLSSYLAAPEEFELTRFWQESLVMSDVAHECNMYAVSTIQVNSSLVFPHKPSKE